MRVSGAGRGIHGVHALGGEHRAVVGAHDVGARREAGPFERGLRRAHRVGGGASSHPGVGVEQRLLEHEPRLVVADRLRVVESARVEVLGGDGALAERGAERADGVGGAEVARLQAHGWQHSAEGCQGAAALRGELAAGDAIRVGGVLGERERLAQRHLGLCGERQRQNEQGEERGPWVHVVTQLYNHTAI